VRFESISAQSFGPFSGETLELTPGFNVIWGLNESGKSSWHAALYISLCGRPRRKGKSSREDEEFEIKHRPWDREKWQVSAIVRLEDSRRIELSHDLLNGFESRVVDVELGRDYRNEILNEGAPDGSAWLGLDRRSFVATACVNQTDLLGVTRSAGLLQEHLQRAAASSSSQSTAAQALARIEEYLSEFIGSNRRNTAKPLRRAIDRLEAAEESMRLARAGHAEYLKLVATASSLRRKNEDLERRLELAAAAAAVREAEQWSARLGEAIKISRNFSGSSPNLEAGDNKLEQEVASVLQAWRQRPAPPKLDGPSSEELRSLIAPLPVEAPKGDLEPRKEVEEAFGAFESLGREISFHENARPAGVDAPHAGQSSADELRNLAASISRPRPAPNAPVEEQAANLARERDRIRRRVRNIRLVLIAVGGLLAMIGAGLLGAGVIAPAVAVSLVGAVFLILAILYRSSSLKQATSGLASLQQEINRLKSEADSWASMQEQARSRLKVLGFTDDPAKVREIAEAVAIAERNRIDIQRWRTRRTELAKKQLAAVAEFWASFGSRSEAPPDADLQTEVQRYRDDCRRRWVAAHQAGRRKELEEQLRIRIQLEQTAADAVQRARSADDNLRLAASKCGVAARDLKEIASALQSWLEERGKDRERLDRDLQKWRALQSTLGGLSIEEFEREADTRAKKAKDLAAKFRLDEVRSLMASESDLDNIVATLRKESTETASNLAVALGRISERERTLASVSEAEEEVEAARLERDRLERLKQTLETARSFLERAQEQAHRSIAPALREAVGRRLPDVTAGRYWDVRVDPESLAIQVCGANGKWRDASALSHGTAEQIYLLLRVALAEQLVRSGEVCPLLLDDVTVHSDTERTAGVLSCLQAISRERQVILFSQQESVLLWAVDNLTEPTGRLIKLDSGDVGV
jgi:hypothetical protein